MLALVFALTPASLASADIEFKSSGPVTIFVDGRQAAQSNPLKHRMSGLESGVHELRVVGMFGKTLYEAEIDLPDNTITYTSWERGEIKVLSTDWLPKEDEAVVEAEPSDTGANDDEQVVVVDPPAEPASEGVPAAAVPVAAAAGAGVAVAASQEPEPVVEPTAVEPEPAVEDAVAAADPAPVEASGVGAAPVVVAAAAVPAAAAASAVAAAPPKPRTITVQATEGMRIEVLQDGRKVILVYENGVFRIEDETGFSMVLGN